MYVPAHFAETRPEELHKLLAEHPLGILVTHTGKGLDANHIPFELDSARGSLGVLQAHVARANPLLIDVANETEVLVIFRGPHGYISPNWYPSKHETHRQVPTWNYEVVHAHGRLRILDDEKFVRSIVAKLSRRHEAGEPRPWKMGDAPSDYLDQMVKMIVGLEVEVTRWEGKRKLGQNRELRDRDGAIRALHERGSSELAVAMERAKA
jgi:transcriptional regulator